MSPRLRPTRVTQPGTLPLGAFRLAHEIREAQEIKVTGSSPTLGVEVNFPPSHSGGRPPGPGSLLNGAGGGAGIPVPGAPPRAENSPPPLREARCPVWILLIRGAFPGGLSASWTQSHPAGLGAGAQGRPGTLGLLLARPPLASVSSSSTHSSSETP